MLKSLLRIFDNDKMDRLHQGALEVLERTGLQIQGDFLLHALADSGCRVDFTNHRAWFKPDLVERQIETQRARYKMVRSSLWYPFCRDMPEHDVSFPDEFIVDYGYATPWIYDYPENCYRKPTEQDQIDMIKLGNAIPAVKAVNAPLICSEFDSRIEIIESARLLLLHTNKPGWVGTSSGKEVKYLAELAQLITGDNPQIFLTQPPLFVAAYCTTSPLKLDRRSCEVLKEALKYEFPINFAPMPILGATAPVTPAGAAIVALAEILGCMTATTLINPDVFYFSTSITGEMDMKTTQICYCSPSAILTDAALHQLIRYRYGMVHNIDPGYVEAKIPGLQAAFMKTYRQMAFGSTVSLPLPIGGLDNCAVFSPTQAMIDLEMNEAIYKLYRGMEIDEDTCAVDEINELAFCERSNYLESEHTVKHFRSVGWYPNLFDRSYCAHTQSAPDDDQRILQEADHAWRRLVKSQTDIEHESGFVKEVNRIVKAARNELMT